MFSRKWTEQKANVILIGDNFVRIGESEKNTGFRESVTNRKIGMVIVTKLLMIDIRFKSDPEWQDFLQHYNTCGFVQVQVPRSETRVLVRKDLLPQGYTTPSSSLRAFPTESPPCIAGACVCAFATLCFRYNDRYLMLGSA
jgi:hypothetical protein